MNIQQEQRSSAWESIRKLLDATKDNPVLTPEEVLPLGAYFAHGGKQMVTLPLALVKQYDYWLRTISDSQYEYNEKAIEASIRLHAKLEEYLLPEELEDHA